MVDFKKQLSGSKVEKAIDPVQLYDTLDRAHDKGPLRPAQAHVLATWFKSHAADRDVIVKLHTGQGKTLIGLLMLQSRLNAGKGPAVYLCPNKFLIAQTVEQAKQFGIPTCVAEPNLPNDFLNGGRILVTSVQKLFNGLTRFGLLNKSHSVGTLLMDDAHACSDVIREQNRFHIPKDDPAYDALLTLFATACEEQGVGTYADIANNERDAFLPVPYWAWIERETDVAAVLSAGSKRNPIKYAWPLLKDMLSQCQCVISGSAIDIEPYIPPLEAFGTYWKAEQRIFMSATVTDDAFLVKGLRLLPETILAPISYAQERWSGERMVLMPSLINSELTRELLVKNFGVPVNGRQYGVVALVPSFARNADWKKYGAAVADDTEAVGPLVNKLRAGDYESTVVLANRYDGIDLPDDTCRVLVFDGKPYSESLVDLYQESCRAHSEATFMRTIRTVEQGMGRSVRGEKDYSVVVILGDDFTRLIRDKNTGRHVSPQTAVQIEIGLKIAEMAQAEIDGGESPQTAFYALIRQCTGRDDGWKAFYIEQMQAVTPRGANERALRAYAAELAAETKCSQGDYAGAYDALQNFLDSTQSDPADKGWYLQELARYQYRHSRTEFQQLQSAAHAANRMLMKPPSGTVVSRLVVTQARIEALLGWVKGFESYPAMNVALTDILGRLNFGTKADKFEQALGELGTALGFGSERPDKEWKEGPDNLWALDETHYVLFECKNEVGVERSEINKRETEQMNRSSAWFDKHYPGAEVRRILIHPSHVCQSAASLLLATEAMRVSELKNLVSHVRAFFTSFAQMNFQTLSVIETQKLVDAHELSVHDLLTKYCRKIKNLA